MTRRFRWWIKIFAKSVLLNEIQIQLFTSYSPTTWMKGYACLSASLHISFIHYSCLFNIISITYVNTSNLKCHHSFLLFILEMLNTFKTGMSLFQSCIKCLYMFLFTSNQDHLTIVRSWIFVCVHELFFG